jgi:hypothetical protein
MLDHVQHHFHPHDHLGFAHRLHGLHFWCQKTLPTVFDDSLSYYEVLCQLACYINDILEDLKGLSQGTEDLSKEIEELEKVVDEIKKEIDDFKEGDNMDSIIDALSKWIDKNLQALVGRIVKYVFFGLTPDGYFCAYIPPDWNFITFDTIMDYNSSLYGHLVLQW